MTSKQVTGMFITSCGITYYVATLADCEAFCTCWQAFGPYGVQQWEI